MVVVDGELLLVVPRGASRAAGKKARYPSPFSQSMGATGKSEPPPRGRRRGVDSVVGATPQCGALP
jgi:hypothetical protein